MRIQPGLTGIAPADAAQAESAIRATWDLPGPVFYRLGKDDKTVVPGLNGRFELGHLQIVGDGRDVLFVVMGAIASEVSAATGRLRERGLECTIAIVASLNPPPLSDLRDVLRRFSKVITVESHYVTGGVGSLVSEVIAESGLACRAIRCGVRTNPGGVTGSQTYVQDLHGLSAAALAEVAAQSIRES